MARIRLAAAIVLQGALAVEVDALRRACGDPSLDRIPAHLTLVPPVNVRQERRADALAVLRDAAAAVDPFRLDLGPVSTFAPETPVLYLAVGGELDALHALRQRIFIDPLARPLSWPFVPHVTLTDSGTPERLLSGVDALSDFRAELDVDAVHLLQQEPDRVWRPMASAHLGGVRVVGRGGIEVQLSVSDRLDPDAEERLAPRARTLAVCARSGDAEVLGVATCTMSGDEPDATLTRIAVSATHQRAGIGSQVLAEIELSCAQAGAQRISATVPHDGGARAFLEARGWTLAYPLPGWIADRTFARLARDLA